MSARGMPLDEAGSSPQAPLCPGARRWWLLVLVLASLTAVVLPGFLAQLRARPPGVPILPQVALLATFLALAGVAHLRALAWLTGTPGEPTPTRDLGLLAAAHAPLLLLGWRLVAPGTTRWSQSLFVVALSLAATVVLAVAWQRRPESRGVLAGLLSMLLALMVASQVLPLRGAGAITAWVVGVGWALYCLAACAGWGVLWNRVAFPGRPLDLGLRAALGLALATVVGGVLNLCQGISPLLLKLGLAAGVTVLAGELWRGRLWRGPRAAVGWPADGSSRWVLGIVVLVMVGLQVAGSPGYEIADDSRLAAFNPHDDTQAYLVFPHKMLETGALGPEPFEARRMLNLGGQSFLQALALCALPVRQLHVIDAGVALLVLVLLVWGQIRAMRMRLPCAALLILMVLTVPHVDMRASTSAVLTGVVLLVAWFRVLREGCETSDRLLTTGTVAVLAGALCALKGTFIPVAALTFFATTVMRARQDGRVRRLLGEVVLTGGLVALVLLPWMIAMEQSSATPLYPILGQGFSGARYYDGFANVPGSTTLSASEYLRVLIRFPLDLAPLLVLIVVVGTLGRHRLSLAFGLAALGSCVVVLLAMDPNLARSLQRYAFPVVTAALLVMMAECLAGGSEPENEGPPWSAVVGVGVALVVLLTGAETARALYLRQVDNLRAGLSGAGHVSADERARYREMLDAVPQGATVLTRVRLPFLLDPTRHNLWVMSFPGMASPPPGMPFFAGAEAVADYLVAHSVRYLAYSHSPDDGEGSLLELSENDIKMSYPNSRVRWAMLRYHQDFHRNVRVLMKTRKHLFDSTGEVVLDLQEQLAPGATARQSAPGDG